MAKTTRNIYMLHTYYVMQNCYDRERYSTERSGVLPMKSTYIRIKQCKLYIEYEMI